MMCVLMMDSKKVRLVEIPANGDREQKKKEVILTTHLVCWFESLFVIMI